MTAAEAAPTSGIAFTIPADSEAAAPAERRGLARDGVRLLVTRSGGVEHRRFHDLPDLLEPGDLVVVNTSATLPAAVDGLLPGGEPAPVHVSTWLDDGSWVVEIRRADGAGPRLDLSRGARVQLPGGVTVRLDAPYPDAAAGADRLWRARVRPAVSLPGYLAVHGRPIRYGYLAGAYPLADYQTVYAGEPGSAEMASAGRPFTPALLTRLVTRGVPVVPIVLHAGVSSLELAEPPTPERYAVPEVTARLVTSTRAAGRRVVAVGTTVVRALETAAAADGCARAGSGWTDLVLGPGRPARVVTGLVTGLHAPQASHLLLLAAVAGVEQVRAAYDAAVSRRYLWHEFGDSTLFLP